MKHLRIAFTGKSGSGKSTAARHLCMTAGYEVLSFASPLRELVSSLFGLDVHSAVKTPLVRKTLQDVGLAMRAVDPDVWIRQMADSLYALPPNAPVVVDDLRFLNEAAFLAQHGFYIVRLYRETLPVLTDGLSAHVSETEQDSIVENDNIMAFSLEELISLVEELL